MAQWGRAHSAIAEDQRLIPRIHTGSLQLQLHGIQHFWPLSAPVLTHEHSDACTYSHMCIIKVKKISSALLDFSQKETFHVRPFHVRIYNQRRGTA